MRTFTARVLKQAQLQKLPVRERVLVQARVPPDLKKHAEKVCGSYEPELEIEDVITAGLNALCDEAGDE